MKKMARYLSTFLILVFLTLPAVAFAQTDEKITLNIWTFTEEVKQQADHYMELNPDGVQPEHHRSSAGTTSRPALDTALMAAAARTPQISSPRNLRFLTSILRVTSLCRWRISASTLLPRQPLPRPTSTRCSWVRRLTECRRALRIR